MKPESTLILKTLVGSRAHGLHREDSDYDYRGVYVTPTREILSLGHNYKGAHWLEGQEDQTTYEIGHFLTLATKCNPSILEVFVAPIISESISITRISAREDALTNYLTHTEKLGEELRALFPYVWNPNDVFNAFVGYGLNQRKKMLDNHLDRWQKYALAYVRTLYNLIDLLETERFSLLVNPQSTRKTQLLDIKNGNLSVGDVVNLTNILTEEARNLVPLCKHEPDLEKVNNFLLDIRKKMW